MKEGRMTDRPCPHKHTKLQEICRSCGAVILYRGPLTDTAKEELKRNEM